MIMRRMFIGLLIIMVLSVTGCRDDTEYFDAGFYDASKLDYINENITIIKFDYDATDAYIKSVITNAIYLDGRDVVSINPFNYQDCGRSHIRYVYIVFDTE